ITFKSSSSTGPQYIELQRAGVANIAATSLPLPITSDSESVCSGHCGWRLQIGSTRSGLTVVGEAARGAAAPITGATARSETWTANGTFLPLMSATAVHTPDCGNV